MERAIVIGAGFAGLAAATELADHGCEVLVLEARERVGGRVWSARVGGEVVERGGEFVLAGYDVLRELAARFGLALADTGMSYYEREPRGVPVDTATVQAAGRAVARAAAGRASVAEALAAAGLPDDVAEAVRARIEISSALESERLRADVLEHAAAFAPLPSHRLEAGNQGLAEAMAQRLGDRVRLGAAVRAITLDGPRVRVRLAAGADVEAERAIVAVPLPELRRPAFAPALGAAQRAAIDRVAMGHAAKLHLPLARPAVPSAVMSVPDRYWCWTAVGTPGVLNCFAGSPSAVDRLVAGDWAARVAELRPELEPCADAAVLTTWPGGAYSTGGLAARPGDEALLAAPAGPLHFAGEHTAGAWAGLMEGALRSGVRAARELLGS